MKYNFEWDPNKASAAHYGFCSGGGGWRVSDLESHLDGEVFEPLREVSRFGTAHLNPDIDTVVWDNGADMSPDFLYGISVPVDEPELMKVAEEQPRYETRNNPE